jgi:hypothetical protein
MKGSHALINIDATHKRNEEYNMHSSNQQACIL